MPRPARRSGTRTAVLTAAAVLVSVLVVLPFGDYTTNPFGLLGLLVGSSFAGAGVVAWRARPRNRVGRLMLLVGLEWLPQQVAMTADPALRPYAVAAGVLWLGGVAHLVVAFPTGRLRSPAARLVVATVYAETVAYGIACLIRDGRLGTPPDPLRAAAGLVLDTQEGATVLLGAAVLAAAGWRWRSASATQRRAVSPVLTAAVTAIVLLVGLKMAGVGGRAGFGLNVVMMLAFAGIPLAHLAGLLRRRIDRAGVADLFVRLRDRPPPANLEAELASALHDRGLRVAYWVESRQAYLDADGRRVELPFARSGQVLTRVDRAGTRLAVLIHDPALLDEPELVDAACAAAALALENERLTADLRARLAELAASRARVLQATERERRRLERDLHDGVQQRLLSAVMALGLAETSAPGDPEKAGLLLTEAKSTVLAALDDLRSLSHGIHPAVLTERGLAGAVGELTAVAPIPVDCTVETPGTLPPEVETVAYYVVNEALANITKHADASRAWIGIGLSCDRLRVEVRDDGSGGADPAAGSGLRGLAERVEAQRGTFEVTSTPGRGTRIRAVLPCG